MRRLSLGLLAILLLISASAHAAPSYSAPAPTPMMQKAGDPDLLSFGAGWMDFDKSERKTHSSDYRFEYRFGYSFIGDHELGFHPFLGFEMSSRDLLYGLGGFAMDWNFSKHGIFTWSEGAGYLDSGKQRSLGGTFQFRSMAEVGYRFNNDMRLTAEFSHISDAKLTRINPGAEIIGVYFHVPVRSLIGGLNP
jgi:lipid A 3-O-deacylase